MKNLKILITAAVLLMLSAAGCAAFSEQVTAVSFDGSDINVRESSSISVENNILVISEGGTYQLTGDAKNVQIMIRSAEPVYIILSEFEIKNKDIIPFNIITNCMVTIESKGLVTNKITCSGEDEYPCIKSKGTVEFTGDTNLKLNGYKGVDANGQININARIEISTEGDAVKAATVTVSSGNTYITSEKDGIQGDFINIVDGSVSITGTSDESRGLYCKESLQINGATIDISTVDDAICSNNSVYISGGNIILRSNDDGLHCDGNTQIDGGTILVKGSLEGIESGQLVVNGGDISIVSSNDGLNAVNADKDSNGSADITINDGNIYIDAGGDGIDANGSIYVNGGVLFVSGASRGDNNAIDFDNEFVVNGGLIAAAGSSEKVRQAETDSLQSVLMINYADIQEVNQEFVLADENGNILLAAVFPKSYNCIIVSSESMVLHNTYYYGIINTDNKKYDYGVWTGDGQADIGQLEELILNSQSTWILSGN